MFLFILTVQHASGVYTLLKGIGYNPIHRKLGVVVSGLGKFIAVGGMILAKWPQYLIISSVVLAVLMTGYTIFIHFGGASTKKETKSAVSESAS